MRRTILAAAASLVIALAAGAASAETPPAQQAPADTDQALLWRALYQTATYQTLSSLDDFAFGYFFGGGAAAASVLVAANGVSEAGVNYLHDLGWALATENSNASANDTRTTRTVTYTAVNTARVFGLGLMLTGNAVVSLGYVAFNAAADAGVYAANDMVWEKVWPTSDRPAPAHRPSRMLALEGYLPDIRLVIREVPSSERLIIREVPSRDGSLFRIIRPPAAEQP